MICLLDGFEDIKYNTVLIKLRLQLYKTKKRAKIHFNNKLSFVE